MLIPGIPAEQLRVHHSWYGPGHGGKLRYEHIPSGIAVGRRIGPKDKPIEIQRQLLVELKEKLQAAGLVSNGDNPHGEGS